MEKKLSKWTLSNVISLYKAGELILKPEYQRSFVWNQKTSTSLILSVLNDLPIPEIIISQRDKKFFVVDGRQRITTFLAFFGKLDSKDILRTENIWEINEFSLKYQKNEQENSNIEKAFFNKNYKTIDKKFRDKIKGYEFRKLILKNLNLEQEISIFKTLNTGSLKLSGQEIRKALLLNISLIFLRKLQKIERSNEFNFLIKTSNIKRNRLDNFDFIYSFLLICLIYYKKIPNSFFETKDLTFDKIVSNIIVVPKEREWLLNKLILFEDLLLRLKQNKNLSNLEYCFSDYNVDTKSFTKKTSNWIFEVFIWKFLKNEKIMKNDNLELFAKKIKPLQKYLQDINPEGSKTLGWKSRIIEAEKYSNKIKI